MDLEVAWSFSVDHAAGDRSVAVDAAVAQKRPVAANCLPGASNRLRRAEFLPCRGKLRRARGRRDRRKTIRPRIRVPCQARNCRECCRSQSRRDSPRRRKRRWQSRARAESCARHRAAPRQTRPSPPDASRSPWDKTRMLAPCSAVRRAPSGYHWSQQTSVPIFPACGVESLEAEIAGSEVKLFVVERIVGNVHLAIDAAQRAIGIENRRRVVIEAGRALLEERRDQHNFILPCGRGQLFRARPGNRLGQIEQRRVFALAEILRLEKFRQADDVRAAAGPPRATRSSALARLSAGSGPHDICTSATVNLSGTVLRKSSELSSRAKRRSASPKAADPSLRSG